MRQDQSPSRITQSSTISPCSAEHSSTEQYRAVQCNAHRGKCLEPHSKQTTLRQPPASSLQPQAAAITTTPPLHPARQWLA